MRVLFLQRQPCIRALKYAVALRGAMPGIELHFAYQGRTLTEWYGAGDELFDGWWPLGHPAADDLRAVLDAVRPDVVHSHNLPDALTVDALGLGPGRPAVVHDVHDLQSLRRTPYEDGFADPGDPLALQARAVEGADALVVVSPEMLDEITALHAVRGPVLMVPNLALARDLPADIPPPDRPRRHPLRAVYEGTLSTNGSHYDLRELFVEACADGLRIDVHPNRDVPEYRELAGRTPGLCVREQLSPAALMAALPAYDLGWAIFNPALNGRHLDTCLPNKAYEYLGAGLPLLTGEHRALARLVREEGVGLSVGALGGLAARLERVDLAALRRRVAAVRGDLTLESRIAELVYLYRALAGLSAPREPRPPARASRPGRSRARSGC